MKIVEMQEVNAVWVEVKVLEPGEKARGLVKQATQKYAVLHSEYANVQVRPRM